MKEIVNGSFCHKYEYIKNIGLDRWKKIDEFYHELGKRLGYDEDTINDSAYEFIDIYAYYKKYKGSYEYMVSMAKINDMWVYINESTFQWACEQDLDYQVIDVMEKNLRDKKIFSFDIEDYKLEIDRLKRIRGF